MPEVLVNGRPLEDVEDDFDLSDEERTNALRRRRAAEGHGGGAVSQDHTPPKRSSRTPRKEKYTPFSHGVRIM